MPLASLDVSLVLRVLANRALILVMLMPLLLMSLLLHYHYHYHYHYAYYGHDDCCD